MAGATPRERELEAAVKAHEHELRKARAELEEKEELLQKAKVQVS
jgi:Skp family chaperone for outer membrane proteins